MFNNIKEKNKALKERTEYLNMMKTCLELYKENKDERLVEFVKWLGTITQGIKKDIDDNDLKKYVSYLDSDGYNEFLKNPLKWAEEHNLTQ
jgi:hypothetical protein